ncbi:MAG: glycosyltransferase family 2 protein [Methanothrix sp.]|nr:glycosyltransferase family 2 protein [Methanothrix sp.]
MTEAPDVSIIIISYNRLELLQATILSLLQHVTATTTEIILVDNASEEPIVDAIRHQFPQVRILRNDCNLGFGCANNIGAQNARGKFLLFANSDLILRGNPLPAMIGKLCNNAEVGIVGCQLLNEDGTEQPSFFRFPNLWMRFLQLSGLKARLLRLFPRLRSQRISGSKSGFVSGAFFMIERDLFFEVGGFDEQFFMYVEDADLAYRVYRKGKGSFLLETSDIIHLGKNYEDEDSPFVYYHMNVGYLIFYANNYRRWRFVILVGMSLLVYAVRIAGSWWGANQDMKRNLFQKLFSTYLHTLTSGGYPSSAKQIDSDLTKVFVPR